MKDIIIYIAQANIALIVMAILYKYLLEKDTHFNMRRVTLLAMVVVAFVFQMAPAIYNFNTLQNKTLSITNVTFNNLQTVVTTDVTNNYSSLINIGFAIWIIGMAALFVRLVIGFGIILKMRHSATMEYVGDTKVVMLEREVAPFSFWKWIFISKNELLNPNLDDIITHEKAHINGVHSADVILSELLSVVFWFNPAVWFIRYAIRENLEFLADKNVLDCGHNRKGYQYSILKLSYKPSVNNIVNYFNVSQLKKRIIMMNQTKSSKLATLKYLLVLPALMLLTLTNNAQTKEKQQSQQSVVVNGVQGKPLVIVDGEKISGKMLNLIDNSKIESINVLKGEDAVKKYGKEGKEGVIEITTKQDNGKKNTVTMTSINGKNTQNLTILVDGVEKTKAELDKIDKDNIELIEITKTNSNGDTLKGNVIKVVMKK